VSKKVLITGVGGFVAHHTLIHLLKNTDWDFVVTDSFRHIGISARLREVFDELPDERKRVKVVLHDLVAPIDNVTAREMGDINVILNLASQSHVDRSIADPRPFVENNVSLVLTMLDYARTLDNLECFIQISTDEVYGPAPVGIFHKEWESLIPSNAYSASKMCQEGIATAYWRSYNIPMIITNTMNIIGERQNVEKFIPKAINCLLNGEPVPIHAKIIDGAWDAGSRYYLHARNQADALMFIVNNVGTTPHRYTDGLARPEKFNVIGEVEISNDKLVGLIADILDIKSGTIMEYTNVENIRPGHDLRYALDGSKLKNMGWKQPVPFEDSLKQTVLWTKAHKAWLKP
jgi:dTDP-glucose 4,6-dehydratase